VHHLITYAVQAVPGTQDATSSSLQLHASFSKPLEVPSHSNTQQQHQNLLFVQPDLGQSHLQDNSLLQSIELTTPSMWVFIQFLGQHSSLTVVAQHYNDNTSLRATSQSNDLDQFSIPIEDVVNITIPSALLLSLIQPIGGEGTDLAYFTGSSGFTRLCAYLLLNSCGIGHDRGITEFFFGYRDTGLELIATFNTIFPGQITAYTSVALSEHLCFTTMAGAIFSYR